MFDWSFATVFTVVSDFPERERDMKTDWFHQRLTVFCIVMVILQVVRTGAQPTADDIEYLKQEAVRAKQERRYQSALEEFEKLVGLAPEDPEVHYHLASLIALTTLRTAEAIEHLERALSLRPDFVPALEGLAEICPLNDEYEKALKALERLNSLRPEEPRYLCRKAEIHTKINQKEKSLETIHEALELAPKDPDVLARAGAIYAHWGATDKAEDYLQKALEINPRNARANFELALLLFQRGDLKAAEALALRSVRANPFVQETHSILARIYASTKRTEDARRELRIGEYLNPMSEVKLGFLKHLLQVGRVTAEEHFVFGEELARVGHPEWGIREIEAGLILEPTAQAPRIPLALAYLEVNQPERAYTVIDRLSDSELRRTEGALTALGWAAYHTERWNVARGAIVAASALGLKSERLQALSDALQQAPYDSSNLRRWVAAGLVLFVGIGLLLVVRKRRAARTAPNGHRR